MTFARRAPDVTISGVTLETLLRLISDGGSITLLALAVIGGFKGWYVWRWNYDAMRADYERQLAELRADKSEWVSVAKGGLKVAERVTS